MDTALHPEDAGTEVDPAWPPALRSAVGTMDAVVVRTTGDERLDYLDAVLSQRLRDLAPGTATAALELGPHGEPTGVLDVLVLDDEVVLVVPRVLAADVVGRLAGRTFLSDASFEVDDEADVLRVRGPSAGADAVVAGLATDVGSVVADDGVLRAADDHGLLLVGPTATLDALRERLAEAGVADADADTLDALEIVTGRPRPPEEIAAGRLPEELGLLPTHVHLAKGCYPGQEAVARMWQLGRPRRRLVVLTGDAPLSPGPIGEERPVEVTRSATVDGHHVALGFASRDVAVGDRPTDGVVVRAIIGDGRPVPGHDPAVTRRRDTR